MTLANFYLKAVEANPNVTFDQCLAYLTPEARIEYDQAVQARLPMQSIPLDPIKNTALTRGFILGIGNATENTVSYCIVKKHKVVPKTSTLARFVQRNKNCGSMLEYLLGNTAADFRFVISKEQAVFTEAYDHIGSCMQGNPAIHTYVHPESSLAIAVLYRENLPVIRCIVNTQVKEYSKFYIGNISTHILGESIFDIFSGHLQSLGYAAASSHFYDGAVFKGVTYECEAPLGDDLYATRVFEHRLMSPYWDESFNGRGLAWRGENTFVPSEDVAQEVRPVVFEVKCFDCGASVEHFKSYAEVSTPSFKIRGEDLAHVFCDNCAPNHVVRVSSLLTNSLTQHKSFAVLNKTTGKWVDRATAEAFLYQLNENEYCALRDIAKYTQPSTEPSVPGDSAVAAVREAVPYPVGTSGHGEDLPDPGNPELSDEAGVLTPGDSDNQ